MYEVYFSRRTEKFLGKLNLRTSTRVRNKLKELSSTPVPSDSKFIRREDKEMVFRYRIGNYRALYTVDAKRRSVLVAKIDKRPRIYKR